MKRIIRFRAWNKRLKEMFKVYQIDFDLGLVMCESESGTRHTFGAIDIELLQHTGCRGNHDAPIYEGDIVRWGENNESVYYNTSEGCFVTETSCLDSESFTVIGNIYQNSELLANHD